MSCCQPLHLSPSLLYPARRSNFLLAVPLPPPHCILLSGETSYFTPGPLYPTATSGFLPAILPHPPPPSPQCILRQEKFPTWCCRPVCPSSHGTAPTTVHPPRTVICEIKLQYAHPDVSLFSPTTTQAKAPPGNLDPPQTAW